MLIELRFLGDRDILRWEGRDLQAAERFLTQHLLQRLDTLTLSVRGLDAIRALEILKKAQETTP